MHAITHTTYGDAGVLRLTDVPRPVPTERDILIRVHAAAVDAGVWHLTSGTPTIVRPFLGIRGPRQPIRGVDVAGVVEEVGSGVTGFAPGDPVFGTCASGSFAEFALSRPRRLARKPDALTFVQAAATPISGGTALQALRAASVGAGSRLLVIGASGGVGSFAVQLAVSLGATVTAVCQKLMGLVASERADDFAELATLIEAGTITPAIDRVVPLINAADAVRALRAGELRGKAVVSVIE